MEQRVQGSASVPLHRGSLTSALESDLKLNPLPGISPPRERVDGEGEPLPRLEEGPERAWAPQEAPEPSLGVRGEAGWERPSSRGASRAPPPQAQGSGLDSSLRPSQPTGQGQRACRDLEPKLSRVRTPGTLAQAPGRAPASPELWGSRPRLRPCFPERGAKVEITEPRQRAVGGGLGPARGTRPLSIC